VPAGRGRIVHVSPGWIIDLDTVDFAQRHDGSAKRLKKMAGIDMMVQIDTYIEVDRKVAVSSHDTYNFENLGKCTPLVASQALRPPSHRPRYTQPLSVCCPNDDIKYIQ